MIDEGYKRLLTEKVANALVDRLDQSSNEALANEDLDRLRRLHTDGQLSIKILLKGLEVVKKNVTLPQKMHDNAEAQIDHLLERFNIDLLKGVSMEVDAQKTLDSEDFQYHSTDVILPASINIDSLSASWTRVIGEELTRFLGQIGPVDGSIRTVPEKTSCHWHPLSWYENAALIRLKDPTWIDKNLVIYYLIFNNGNIVRLNGTSPTIHHVNSEAPIKLSEANVADYLHFFCFFVRGDEGPFYLVEDVEDPLIPHFECPTTQEMLLNNIAPITYKGQNEQGHFLFSATVFYSNALFAGEFAVHPTGMVEMLGDTPIAGDLPIRIDAPISNILAILS